MLLSVTVSFVSLIFQLKAAVCTFFCLQCSLLCSLHVESSINKQTLVLTSHKIQVQGQGQDRQGQGLGVQAGLGTKAKTKAKNFCLKAKVEAVTGAVLLNYNKQVK